jgi:hypothetical protein
MVLAPDSALKRLGGLLQPIFLIGLDQFYGASGYSGSLTPSGEEFLQRQRVDQLSLFFSADREGCVYFVV